MIYSKDGNNVGKQQGFEKPDVGADGEKMVAGGRGGPMGRMEYAYRPEKGSRLLGRVVGVLSMV